MDVTGPVTPAVAAAPVPPVPVLVKDTVGEV